MSAWKRLKYRTLRYVPGQIGRRYTEKYAARGTQWKFRDAVDETAGMIAIDLGANIGEYTNLLARKASRVIAFEPDPWALEKLRKNTQSLKNVEIIAAAAGAYASTVKLYRHPEFSDDPVANSQSSSVVSDKRNISNEDFFEVPQIDMIDFIRGIEGEIGVLKVDIEGAEVDLFEAMFDQPDVMSRIHYIFAETHETKIPGHEPRVAALKARAEKMIKPVIDLNWH